MLSSRSPSVNRQLKESRECEYVTPKTIEKAALNMTAVIYPRLKSDLVLLALSISSISFSYALNFISILNGKIQSRMFATSPTKRSLWSRDIFVSVALCS